MWYSRCRLFPVLLWYRYVGFTRSSKTSSSRATVFHVKSKHVRRNVRHSWHCKDSSDSSLRNRPFAMPYLDSLSVVLPVMQRFPYPSYTDCGAFVYLTAFCQLYEFYYVIRLTVCNCWDGRYWEGGVVTDFKVRNEVTNSARVP